MMLVLSIPIPLNSWTCFCTLSANNFYVKTTGTSNPCGLYWPLLAYGPGVRSLSTGRLQRGLPPPTTLVWVFLGTWTWIRTWSMYSFYGKLSSDHPSVGLSWHRCLGWAAHISTYSHRFSSQHTFLFWAKNYILWKY